MMKQFMAAGIQSVEDVRDLLRTRLPEAMRYFADTFVEASLEACKPALRRAGGDLKKLREYVDTLVLPFACLLEPSYFDAKARRQRRCPRRADGGRTHREAGLTH